MVDYSGPCVSVVCRTNPDGSIKELLKGFTLYEQACAYLDKLIDDPNKPIYLTIRTVDLGG